MIEGWFFKHIFQSQCTNKISNTIYPSAFDNTDIAKALSIMVKNFKSLSKNNKKDRIKKKIYNSAFKRTMCSLLSKWTQNRDLLSCFPWLWTFAKTTIKYVERLAGRVTKFLTTDKNSTHCMFDQIHSVIYFCQL